MYGARRGGKIDETYIVSLEEEEEIAGSTTPHLETMWLLNTTSLRLHEFVGDNLPPYAILSHTWSSDEFLYHEVPDWPDSLSIKAKPGFVKVARFCERANREGFSYSWVDSCCIDKSSSAQLSEAINSMYEWYKDAEVCMVYLEDVPGLTEPGMSVDSEEWLTAFENGRWFTRGWTLQELIAPKKRVYFARDWSVIDPGDFNQPGQKLVDIISGVTRISPLVLQDSTKLSSFCVAERMSWASLRTTTRPEDRAYSLMGLFSVNMPILYGEGFSKAFSRLQDEIMKTSFDQTIFA